jgi:hypothetical protein
VFVALALHLLCLVLLAAGGIGGGFLHLALARMAHKDPRQALVVARIGARFGMVATSAALLMLATGIGLLATRGWADWGRPWLSAKLTIFVLLFLNGLLVAKPNGARLGAALAAAAGGDQTSTGAGVEAPLRRMGVFHAVQSAGLVALILLGVFGPR